MSDRIERALLVLIATATLVVAGITVKRELRGTDRSTLAGQYALNPDYVADWKSVLSAGVPLDSNLAPVSIIEFVDLECPVCRQFHQTLHHTRRRFGDSVSITLVHFPLEMHRFARQAARAAECARAIGEFPTFIDVVFSKQDSIGLKSWASYAKEAGIKDTSSFSSCAMASSPVPLVQQGIAAGERLGIRGTPMIIVNGWRFRGAIPDSVLQVVVRSVLNGERPFETGKKSKLRTLFEGSVVHATTR